MKLEVRNIEKVKAQVNRWVKKQEKLSADVARGISVTVLNKMIQNSPQWSGDFAANWRYSINHWDFSYDVGAVPPKPPHPSDPLERSEPYKQFDRPAIQVGYAQNWGKDAGFKLGDTAYISNSSMHDEPYAKGIFDLSVKLRDVNLNVLLKSVWWDLEWSSKQPLTYGQARRLGRRRIGGTTE